ncbi:MAG TPA: hypothetical protein VGD02_02500 [Gemmatimonadaceae bacterium]|jgi:hypothetical protein
MRARPASSQEVAASLQGPFHGTVIAVDEVVHRREAYLPVVYEIDAKRRLVTTRCWGAVSPDEIYQHNQQLRTDPAFDPSYRQVADMTAMTAVTVSTNVVTETALDQFFTPGTRRAFVATHDGVFGMARMYSLHAESLGQTIEVFREIGAAKDWVEAV